MAGRGPAPKANRRRTNAPARGDWRTTPAVGWQHGAIPAPPDDMRPVSVKAWETWFGAWFASHWTPADLPGLRVVIGLYDLVERGRTSHATELRQLMDNYGITPKGQQDRRWVRPDVEPESKPRPAARRPENDYYRHLRVVDDEERGA